MAVRIYAFAKELGLDNKQLLDICEQVGIKGKGSALASLEDDEIQKITKFMESGRQGSSAGSGGGGSSPKASADTPVVAEPTRNDILPNRVSPLRDLSDRSRKKKDKEVGTSAANDTAVADHSGTSTDSPPPTVAPGSTDADSVEEVANDRQLTAEIREAAGDAVTGLPTDDTSTDSPSGTRPLDRSTPAPERGVPERGAPERGAPERGQPLRPLQMLQRKGSGNTNATGKSPVIKKDRSKRSTFNVASIAAMPDVKQPTPGSGRSDVKVQKPDIAMPQDAIAKVRTGAAPLEQFTKQSKTNKDKKKVKGRDDVAPVLDPAAAAAAAATAKLRGKFTKPGGDDDTRELGSTRQTRTRRREKSVSLDGEDEVRRYKSRDRRNPKRTPNTAAPRKEKVTLQLPCTVRTFSEAAGVSAVQVLLVLPKLGETEVRNINSNLNDDVVELLLDHFDIEHIELKLPESVEDRFMAQVQSDHDKAENIESRPPIVTFLGHVDHGKTSLLDAIIGIDVVSGEAGGITQHIRAYQVEKDGRKIAFVDTPGHEAFTEMRARGANVTDIAVLVVAADDGVMPQTEEAISHIKAAKVPIIVAMNKVDLPGANPDKVYQDLATHGLLPSEWGGDVEVVRTSAIKKEGIDNLLETILVTAELYEFKADSQRAAYGTCLESEQQAGRGVVAKMIVQGGTLRVGDIIVCGSSHGRIKAMYDTLKPQRKVEQAGPSTPVNVTGLDVPPDAGDKFYVLPDIAEAREIAQHRENRFRQKSLGGITTRVSLEEFQSRIESGTLGKVEDLVTLNLIIRADTRGSIEALQKELSKIEHPEIRINILQALVGGVTIADVRLAQASEAVIIGFNVVPDEASRSLADELQVQIRRYDIIYKVSDDIKATLEGRLKPDKQVVELGMAMVRQTFSISKIGTIAGCRVMRGTIQRDGRVRLIRDSRVIGEYAIDSLKREKDDAREVQRGMDCGIKLVGFNDIKEGDTLEVFKIEEVARTL